MSTPPPQGHNPFAQPGQPGQPGYPGQPGQPGQAFYDQNPYGQQPGAPGPYGQPGGPMPGAPMPPRRNPAKKILAIVAPLVLIGVLALIGVIVGVLNSDDAEKLAVGDCLQNKGSDNDPELEKLDCSDSEATHKVLKKVENTRLAMTACRDVEGVRATFTMSEGSDSFVLCLGANN